MMQISDRLHSRIFKNKQPSRLQSRRGLFNWTGQKNFLRDCLPWVVHPSKLQSRKKKPKPLTSFRVIRHKKYLLRLVSVCSTMIRVLHTYARKCVYYEMIIIMPIISLIICNEIMALSPKNTRKSNF